MDSKPTIERAQPPHLHAALENPHWIGSPSVIAMDSDHNVMPWPDEPKATCRKTRHYDEVLTGWHHGCYIEYCDPSPEFIGATFCIFHGPWRTAGAIWAPLGVTK